VKERAREGGVVSIRPANKSAVSDDKNLSGLYANSRMFFALHLIARSNEGPAACTDLDCSHQHF
jgi:hypothetical protein